MPTHHDAIVIGAGGVGGAAMVHLARAGLRVLGIDRFAPPHDRGSSHGDTRVIRKAYFEHPDYVPVLERAYALWAELEAEAGERLLHRVGVLQIDRPGGALVPAVLATAATHRLAVETLEATEVAARFPALRIDPTARAVFEPDAGYLLVERCVAAHLALARRLGAGLEVAEVTGIRPDGAGFVVDTTAGSRRADRVAVCGGAWAGQLLADLGLPLTILRKPLHWFATDDRRLALDAGFPVWLVDATDGIFYGFPATAGAIKLAEHTGGDPVADPLALDRAPCAGDEARLRGFLAAHLPGVTGRVTRHAACMYTMTPDQHFIVDRHPVHPGLALVAGLSGHGFKMASALGEAVADLLVSGRSRLPLELVRLDRPALRTPPGPGA